MGCREFKKKTKQVVFIHLKSEKKNEYKLQTIKQEIRLTKNAASFFQTRLITN